MDGGFEVEYLDSLNNVNRKPSRAEGLASTFNVLILMLGFGCIAVGYVLSNTSREQLGEFIGRPNASIERQAPTSIGKSISRISRPFIELVS